MIAERELFQQAEQVFAPPEDSFERLVRLRARRERRRRIEAAAVGVVVAAVAILAALRLVSMERSRRA